MAQQYKLNYSQSKLDEFNKWDQLYPPMTWEVKWNHDVALIQGNSNVFIDRWECAKDRKC